MKLAMFNFLLSAFIVPKKSIHYCLFSIIQLSNELPCRQLKIKFLWWTAVGIESTWAHIPENYPKSIAGGKHFSSIRNRVFPLKNSVRQVFCTVTKLYKMFTVSCFFWYVIHVSSNPLWVSRSLPWVLVSKWYLLKFSLHNSFIPLQITL